MIYEGPDADYTGRTIAFCYNGSNSQPLTIVDVTDPTDASTISTTAYPDQHYCHQGWLTEDGAYMLMDDEIDESSEGYTQTRTLIWDMHDLDNPLFMGPHFGTTEAIDHNQYIIGNLAYQSNYTAGLQIMDVTEIADTTISQVGWFDHYQVNNATSYDGQWMSYPFFESGVVPCTDIGNGLFLVQPNFIHVEHAPGVCSNSEIEIQVVLENGFAGPYTLALNELPDVIISSISNTNIEAPDTIVISLSGLESSIGVLQFEIEVEGAFYTYSRSVSMDIEAAMVRYTDADGDGFGNSEMMSLSCDEIPGTSLAGGDCNDMDNTVYPGAPGTSDNIDNNCNEVIDPTEVNTCADLDGDLIITINDLFIFNGDSGCSGENCIADINNDGIVSVLDLLILIADFGEVCD